jgi:hypothetical protein
MADAKATSEQANATSPAIPAQTQATEPVGARSKGRKLDAQIPYLATPGSIKTALERIRAAATPDRVTSDFVSTKLQIRGGQGAAVAAFLKKIGLVGSDGSPTALYRAFRNQATGGAAIAAAIKSGYKALGDVNEYFYEMDDQKLRGLIVQVTGSEPDSSSTRLIVSTLRTLKEFADFEASTEENNIVPLSIEPTTAQGNPNNQPISNGVGLNLSYTINLNLPPTSDQAVFNAIFKSLKEHLLSNE